MHRHTFIYSAACDMTRYSAASAPSVLPYQVTHVLTDPRPLESERLEGLRRPTGAIVIGGGALNHGPPPVAVATDHSPRLAGAVGAGWRGLYAVLRLLPVRGLAVLVPERDSEGSEDRRDDNPPAS